MTTDLPGKPVREMKDVLPAHGPQLFDLSSRAKLRVTGADRTRFLNGQITNDVTKASDTAALEACVLNAKGKLNGHLFFSAGPDSFLLDADPTLREMLANRLERYVIADDVAIEDVTDRFAVFHVLVPDQPQLASEWRVVHVRRFATAGWDIWVGSENSESAKQQLTTQFSVGGEEDAEILRIESGIPRWDRELTAEIIPIEANLEERCVDYDKGCYIGQEVISRIKMSGQTNKRLCGLVSTDGEPISPGARLHCLEDGREVGWITSAAWSARFGRQIALGFVKRGYNSPGNFLQLKDSDIVGAKELTRVEVVSLPFR